MGRAAGRPPGLGARQRAQPVHRRAIRARREDQAFTGRAGLVYLADNGLAPFLSYSQSFEPTTGQDRQGSRFKPTEGEQYEAGLRYQPAGSDTMLSAAVPADAQEPHRAGPHGHVVPDPGRQGPFTRVGLEARTRIGRNANLIAAYAYTDAHAQGQPLAARRRRPPPGFGALQSVLDLGDYGFGDFGLAGPARRRRPALCGQHTRHGAWHGGRGAVLHAARRHGQLHHGTVALRAERHQPGRQDLHRQLHHGCFYGEPAASSAPPPIAGSAHDGPATPGPRQDAGPRDSIAARHSY